MTIIYPQFDEQQSPEVIDALTDLAALARRASWTAHEHFDSVANDMLKRLLALCKAQYGAVLLREDHLLVEQFEPAPPDPARARAFRAFALHRMLEEEAYASLTTSPAKSPGIMRGLIYRLSLSEERADDKLNRLQMPPDDSFDQQKQAQRSLLVIGWTDQQEQDQEHSSAAQLRHCSILLPVIAIAVETVITTILLKERVYKLERQATRAALDNMEWMKAELLGTVSHELRGPLASIKGYAATLLRQEGHLAREERHQFLLAIHEASDMLEVIVERLLEVSQFETGQVSLERSPVDMAHLASEAIVVMEEHVAASLPGRFAFRLQLESSDGTPSLTVPLILADHRRLRTVLDNLLENAIKYSPEGGRVSITIRPVVQPFHLAKEDSAQSSRHEHSTAGASISRKMLEICVTDNGLGIPVEHLERIFDRFHRVDMRLTREVNGLGLGLTICKRIVELHGGVIWAENRPGGRGSAFYVLLPIEESAILS